MDSLGADKCLSLMERNIVGMCAPTLMGFKPSSMFTFPRNHCIGRNPDGSPDVRCADRCTFLDACSSVRRALAEKGLDLDIVPLANGGHTVFVSRPGHMAQVVGTDPVATALEIEGYPVADVDACKQKLFGRIGSFVRTPRDFLGNDRYPHEIGLFLGYPIDDVVSFVRQRAKGVLLRGHWNVYHDCPAARETFALYDLAISWCLDQYALGFRIEQIACS